MTVEVALAVLSGAQAERLLVCDEDDQCSDLVTRKQLAAVRESPSYTDHLRLRDVIDVDGPFAGAATMAGTRQAACCDSSDQRCAPAVGHDDADPLSTLSC
ncbi:hypothetical protein [Yinghuangia soli]|uniref:CBS domain-containing protein n=1 Tax=Yinghuangia soli TaxID=2908204 RepID=A0AA41U0D2_9ACTN|nr:hypothetical protein [Yinghuangia soli]MCF2529693.1 hypothetical protein [Yinghuangia soli]